MTRRLPKSFGEPHPDRTCGRTGEDGVCGAAPAWHVVWLLEQMDQYGGSLACEEHIMEVLRKYDPEFIHKVTPGCLSERGKFHPDINTCLEPPEQTYEVAEVKEGEFVGVGAGIPPGSMTPDEIDQMWER